MNSVAIVGGFHVLGPLPVTQIELAGGFHLFRGLLPNARTLTGDFEVLPPDPSVFVWDHEWVPAAQRAWTDAGWFPEVL